MSRERRSIMIRGDDGQELSLGRRLASALVQHPHTRSTLVRQGLFSAALAVLWLLAGISRLAGGGRVLAGLVVVGALFFAVRAAAHGIMIMSLPPDHDASKRSGNVEDS